VSGRIPTRTVIWAAGVAASPLGKSLGVPLDRAGRVIVNPDLSVPGTPDVFVIGDLASILKSDGKPVPGLAPAAMQEGRHAARNVMHAIRGESSEPFGYIDKGTLATIGRGAAVAEVGRLRLSGFVAWIAWLFIHIFYLIGFRNRFMVLAGWAWVYLRNESGARLITGDIEPLLERGESGNDKHRMSRPNGTLEEPIDRGGVAIQVMGNAAHGDHFRFEFIGEDGGEFLRALFISAPFAALPDRPRPCWTMPCRPWPES
jgi:hypothetical protein